MKINEVAKLAGITVRTLHYYDEIGLLKPMEIGSGGYRVYGEKELETLQQILFFKELDFPLGEIKEIMTNPAYNKAEALGNHRELLIEKRDRLNGLISLVENTLKGEKNMSFKEFDTINIEENRKKYAKEIKERWGTTKAYAESEKKTSSYNKEQWGMLNDEGSAILKEFSNNMDLQPNSEEIQGLVKKWQDYITKNFYNCTKEILSCLGIMYTEDKRFTENIDKNGQGTAQFISDAIAVYCKK